MNQPVTKLIPGMELENDVFLSGSRVYLFPKGKVLSAKDIEKLEEKNVKQVFINEVDCGETFFPFFQSYARKVVKSKNIEEMIRLAARYSEFVKDVSDFSFDMTSYSNKAFSSDAHRVHVANMAVALATTYNRSQTKEKQITIHEMAESALLCDIGRYVGKSPELLTHLRNKYGHQLEDFQKRLPNLPSDIFDSYQSEYHSFYSYLLLKDYPISTRALEAILYSHESVRGKSGYLGVDVTGNTARDIMSKILKVCEFYDMILYRWKEIPPNSELYGVPISTIMVTAANTGAIDLDFTEQLLKIVPQYPIGSKVVLSDGSYGKVVYYSEENSLYPIVQTEADELIEITNMNQIIGFDEPEEINYHQALM